MLRHFTKKCVAFPAGLTFLGVRHAFLPHERSWVRGAGMRDALLRMSAGEAKKCVESRALKLFINGL